MKIKNNTLDIIAISSSLICVVHCVAAPIVLSLGTFSGIHFLANPFVEMIFICLGFIFVLTSLWPSYHKIHRKLLPLQFAALGFFFIGLGRLHFTDLWEISNTIIGTVLVSLAHYFNWRILRNGVYHKQ